MINKLFRQSFKPFSRVVNEKAYKEWLRLFDFFKDPNLKYPIRIEAMGITWQVHHGASFLNQFESIFVDQIYQFNCDSKTPVIIDCGANMGTSVLYFKWLFPKAKVFAFEPDKHIFEVLKDNISKNNLSEVMLFNKAVWINDQAMFFENNNAQSGKLIFNEKAIKVECLRLKDFMQTFEKVDFLKLDIEGAELPVLMDIASELHRVKHLFIEYHSMVNEPQKLSALLEILEKEKFRYFIGGNQSKSPFINQVCEEGMDLTLDIFATPI
jgi:FkbM family methyltransferase